MYQSLENINKYAHMFLGHYNYLGLCTANNSCGAAAAQGEGRGTGLLSQRQVSGVPWGSG